jgi:O-antigen/teichoic acid export membrane protein
MKSLRSDLVLTVFSHLLTKPVWLIADNLIQDRLGHETYGLIGALHSYATWANVIADWSLSYHIARQIAQASHLIRPIAAQTLLPKLFLSLFTGGLFLFLGYLVGYAKESLWWLSGLLGYQILLSWIQYFRSFFQGAQLFRVDALLANAEKAVVIVLILVFWRYMSGHLYIVVLVAGSGIALGGIGLWAWKQFGPWSVELSRKELWSLFRRLTPYAVLVLVGGLNERLNQVLIERLAGPYENGLYLGAYRWFGASMMYLWVVLPIFYARFAMLGHRPTPTLWRTFLMGQLSAAIPLMAVTLVMLVEPELFLILFRHSTEEELRVMAQNLQILAIAATLNALFNIYSTHLTANGQERASLMIIAFATIVNMAGCWWWVPRYGAIGGSLALLVSYATFSVGHYVLFQRWVGLARPVGSLPWLLLGIWLGVGGCAYLLRGYLPFILKGVWGGGAVLVYGVVLYLGGILHLWRRVSRV